MTIQSLSKRAASKYRPKRPTLLISIQDGDRQELPFKQRANHITRKRYVDCLFLYSKLLKASVKQLRDDIRPHIDAILQLVEEQSAYAKSIGATEEELSQMDGYRFVEELCEYVG